MSRLPASQRRQEMKNRSLTIKASILACGLVAAAAASAQEVVLKFATLSSPTMHLARDVLVPWAERVNVAGKGIVRIEPVFGENLANQANVYSRVQNNVVQVAWGLQVMVRGQFPLTDLVALPFIASKAEDSSVALWRLYASGKLAAEYKDIVPMALVVFPQYSVHATKPVKSLDDIRGMKVRAGGKVASDIVTALGGAPVSMSVSDMYQALSKQTVDATLVQWTAFQPFKLDEVTSHHLDGPFGSSAGMIFMARKAFDELPAGARDVIQKNSGEALSREYGAFWDRVQLEARNRTAGLPRHTLGVLSAQDAARGAKALSAVTDSWVRDTPGGAEILKAFREELSRIEARK
ncbi:MAG: TRAP transporter substrate-binding protein [Burkholderiales bacterium]|nr:TRAP transporter substrate-binding protein [Burkholderiales bacterium]